MKKLLLKIFILPYILLIVHIICNFQEIKLDGLDAELYSLFSNVDTRYTDKFTQKKFADIHKWMTEEQVYALIGKPFTKSQGYISSLGGGDYSILIYSLPVDGKSYRVRIVYIENGLVRDTKHEMYYD